MARIVAFQAAEEGSEPSGSTRRLLLKKERFMKDLRKLLPYIHKDLLEIEIIPDESTRCGPLVLYKSRIKVYSSIEYKTINFPTYRDEKGRLVVSKQEIVKARGELLGVIE